MNKLREIRLKAGYPLIYVARKLGYSRQTIYNWEKGKFLPTRQAMTKLCDLYQTTPEEMFWGNTKYRDVLKNILNSREES